MIFYFFSKCNCAKLEAIFLCRSGDIGFGQEKVYSSFGSCNFLRIALCLDNNAIYIIDDKLETKYMSCDITEPKNSVHIPVKNFE